MEKRGSAGGRTLFLLPAGASLIVGIDAGLALAGVPVPVTDASFAQAHGILMVLGLLGTLIALERAVAARRAVAYLAPALLGLGALASAMPANRGLGRVLLVEGALALVLLYAHLWRRSRDDTVLVQGLGAVLAGIAAGLWPTLDLAVLAPWLVGFVVLTVAAERVELARLAMPAGATSTLVGLALAFTGACVLDLTLGGAGRVAVGLALRAIVGWLARHDVARRTIRSRGLPRFGAAAMLAGYVWLAVAAVAWIVSGVTTLRGSPSDAAVEIGVHAALLGFAMSMVMAHAPIILPAVMRRPFPYRPVLWVPLVALHLAVAWRVGAAATTGLGAAWRAGAAATALALLVFVAVAATLVLTARPRRRAAHPVTTPGRTP